MGNGGTNVRAKQARRKRDRDLRDPASLLRTGLSAIPAERLWVNPGCGPKTRGWPETRASPENLVAAARTVRSELDG